MPDQRFHIMDQLLWPLIYKFDYLQTFKYDFGTGYALNVTEMLSVDAIGRNPGMNITGLARNLAVTKGAISQIIKKLNENGFVRRYHPEGNRKEVHLALTEKGIKIFKGYDEFHTGFLANSNKFLNDLSEEQFSLLVNFFELLNHNADRYIEYAEQQ